MAKPIKETPVFKGKDAAIFAQKIESAPKISPAELEVMRTNYRTILSNIKTSK